MSAELVAALTRLRELISLPGNDFSWSSWVGPDAAVAELDHLIADVRDGNPPAMKLAFVVAPTGPAHETAISSGWAGEFETVAAQVDSALEQLRRERESAVVRRAEFACSRCDQVAGAIEIDTVDGPGVAIRTSFTSTMRVQFAAAGASTLRKALADSDSATVFALDPELAPWYCPMCPQSYCGLHWDRWDIYDADFDSWHDSVAGRCPEGHERMLED